MIKKQPYTAPEAEILELMFEAPLLDASLTGNGFGESTATEQDLSNQSWW